MNQTDTILNQTLCKKNACIKWWKNLHDATFGSSKSLQLRLEIQDLIVPINWKNAITNYIITNLEAKFRCFLKLKLEKYFDFFFFNFTSSEHWLHK